LPLLVFFLVLVCVYYCCSDEPIPPGVLFRALWDDSGGDPLTLAANNGGGGASARERVGEGFPQLLEAEEILGRIVCRRLVRLAHKPPDEWQADKRDAESPAPASAALLKSPRDPGPALVLAESALGPAGGGVVLHLSAPLDAPRRDGGAKGAAAGDLEEAVEDADGQEDGDEPREGGRDGDSDNGGGDAYDAEAPPPPRPAGATAGGSASLPDGPPAPDEADADGDVELGMVAPERGPPRGGRGSGQAPSAVDQAPEPAAEESTSPAAEAAALSAAASQSQHHHPSCDICLCEYAAGEILAWSGATGEAASGSRRGGRSSRASAACCPHYFHRDCVVDWLRSGRSTCPSCRREFLGPPPPPPPPPAPL
jgi:hypothetical protein